MNIFSYVSYREVIEAFVIERKALDRKYSFQNLAAACRIQKTYLSRVIKGKAELNSDQLYLAADFMELDENEREYFSLLLEFARTGLKVRRDQLRVRIQAIQAQHRESHEHLEATPVRLATDALGEYYLDPLHQIIHICLTIKRYQDDLVKLATDLERPLARVRATVMKLEKMGLAEKKGASWRAIQKEIHLVKESPVYPAWRNQLRLLSLQRLQAVETDEQSYSFSVVFSSDMKTRNQVHAAFLEFLKATERKVKGTEPEHTFQLNFDLFKWV
ncbi:MAG: TIGR02147 family protein [Bacteriovoracia bacterium]